MTIDDRENFGPLRVVRVLSNGKRRFDPVGKERLIEASMKPGVSIAGLARDHGVNANQLHKWLKRRRDLQGSVSGAMTVTPNCAPPSAFVPVVEALPIARRADMPARASSPGMRLKASLPNGVRLELEDADGQALSVMIEALGRFHAPVR